VIAGVLDRTGLYEDCPFSADKKKLTAEEAETVSGADFDAYAASLVTYLGVLEQRLFSEGLHVFGERPQPAELAQYLDAYFDKAVPDQVVKAIAHLDTPENKPTKVLLGALLEEMKSGGWTDEELGPEIGVEEPPYHWYNSLPKEERYAMGLFGWDLFRFYFLRLRRALGDQDARSEIEQEVAVAMGPDQGEGLSMEAAAAQREGLRAKLTEGIEIKRLLEQNTQELRSVVKALNGEYVLPGVGGDLLRDGTGVLPTGRNIHALDPYRLPSPGAWAR
jgi:magnesium chelatase subunit H